MIKKILIANRGEIAVRVIRACKELNIKSVAVYSSADKDAMHVQLADESICIGPSKATDSYLNIPSLLSAYELTGADSIHPGYGFLSENYEFAKILEDHKINFIGPSANLIKKMGDKIEAKKIAKDLGLPTIKGSDKGIIDIKEAEAIAEKIGYPVLIKASGGGGGKGMKIVFESKDLEKNVIEARSEAKKFFNNDEVFIEKFFQNPRHIEVQILSDGKKVIHLGERDCTVQRRYQKLIEESPSPVLSDKEREGLLETSVNSISKLGYKGAGTLEFIYENGEFYFLEMNTRLQVEHPVSEAVSGVDLVKRQIEIASSNNLDLEQSSINFNGHAIECRINAENFKKNFQPSAGTISSCHIPSGPGTRVDSAIYQGCKVQPFYDSMIAKLISHGRDRKSAISRSLRALDEFVISGINTTIDLHQEILRHKDFLTLNYNVNWLTKSDILK
ncbi:MAG: acetyl-CoA carboxylase biotin carboxylase subunit [Candidatus Pelagibacter sp.]|nr:acetyl-CoA carboxylase biotin carboxylase subunit [Candidatus Pelagibacter sp.]OUV87372.1 MAG: acetyl-CoA carboxylase biotin carboxylase subunit [Pelagibacteraceae bacterium TMED136]|tara:strand:- start:8251 stop:9591 length:1341 start_codon:yes stop_codon:yes gene_type:complete